MGSFWSHPRLKLLWNTLRRTCLNIICPFKGNGYPFFASQKASSLDLVQAAWHKHLPYCTNVPDLKVLAVTVGVELF